MDFRYDVIVIGAGHAGCEAASAAARLGVKVLLITMDMNKIAQMSCNPSIGGIAKGQIVREIDALGGFSGIVTDASTLQFRMLNRSKGPAMWSPRAQCDRMAFSMNWRWILENTPNLVFWQDTVTHFNFSSSGDIDSLETSLGGHFSASYYILTAGTFLNGRIFVGDRTTEGGRVAEPSSYFVSRQLCDRGITTARMKTGTPPRVDIRSVNTAELILQQGDERPEKFSFLPYLSSAQRSDIPQMDCYIAHTNATVHDILRSAFDKSPLFSGKITGIGPRYCPSIEDKLRTFADKDSHQIFLEPEGRNSTEYYLQGFSSSLPFETQINALVHVPGFEHVHLLRPAYAIEYDYFDPVQLDHTLRSRVVSNLFLAGQVNGTTGYEEAGAQGIIAGIKRDTSYIGVLIDDLVTKGVDEPYRMFTSRAEYRILLRQDNTDERLTPLSHQIGLASDYRMRVLELKRKIKTRINSALSSTRPTLDDLNTYLGTIGSSPLSSTRPLYDLISRPGVTIRDLYRFVPRGTKTSITKHSYVSTQEISSSLPAALPDYFKILFSDKYCLLSESLDSCEIELKYRGYIDREIQQAQKLKRLENLSIPDDFDYAALESLSIEARMKLTKHRPRNIAEASRIPGVSPSDVSVLLVYFGR